jgi:hypothetical protein
MTGLAISGWLAGDQRGTMTGECRFRVSLVVLLPLPFEEETGVAGNLPGSDQC